MDLYDALDWIDFNARVGGNYILALGQNEAILNVSLDTRRLSYLMFTVGEGVTFIIEEGVVLTGLSTNSTTLVEVKGGTFIMNNGILKNNTLDNSDYGTGGGGVYVNRGGIFTKSGTGVVIYGSNTPGGKVNKAPEGTAVYVVVNNNYRKRRDTTAWVSDTLDSRRDGGRAWLEIARR